MEQKILITVTLPATRKSYDFWIPANMEFREVVPLVTRIIGNRARDYFQPTSDAVLMSLETGEPIAAGMTPKAMGLVNGTRLVLV